MRITIPALVLSSLIGASLFLCAERETPATVRSESAVAPPPGSPYPAASNVDPSAQRDLVAIGGGGDRLAPDDPRSIDRLPAEIAERVGYIYRRFDAAYRERDWELPPLVPRISLDAARALIDKYDEYWAQYDVANDHYEQRMIAVLDLGGEFTGTLPSSESLLPDFRSLAREQLGDRYLGAEGHSIAVNDGETWRWGYFPPGADLEVDELCAWCDSFEDAAPDVYRGWFHDYFTF